MTDINFEIEIRIFYHLTGKKDNKYARVLLNRNTDRSDHTIVKPVIVNRRH